MIWFQDAIPWQCKLHFESQHAVSCWPCQDNYANCNALTLEVLARLNLSQIAHSTMFTAFYLTKSMGVLFFITSKVKMLVHLSNLSQRI